ncbi:mannitol dehydrogenase family protein [Verminephrobacter aporrectodeae subsp. tuberculatae]|uniref:D-arabinitol 4-dehydrogenase n=1 Tax=Verminephrobacter aporrectodeae TaxID=1110389 RepID=UPI0022443C40|nr:D-arabinitol 4-dehydrogenase [Verminephrobacter aporrectodeae]MCW8205974.1 mannitol dehydrogenase family protein [Verminephrobacter aporrectodeae subsp. tuberculatae]
MTTDPSPLTILHLGLGAFHRAHQALYLQQLHALGDHRWVLASGNLRPDMQQTIAALQAQQGAYTLETVSAQGVRSYTRVESIRRVLAYTPDLAALVALAQQPGTRIISFTVTEAGYYLDSRDQIDWDGAPELRQDLQALRAGSGSADSGVVCTLYGALSVMLRARMRANAGAVTLLCCDNLRHNGDRTRSGLLQFVLALGDAELAHWISMHSTSPNAMVDRITPRPTPDVVQRVRQATGRDDPAALMAESFIQWVMEDRFAHGRPAWERVGVELVESVVPYEEAKIRLLNATHCCIAWAGTLAGYRFIHEGTQDRAIRQMAFDYMTDDAIPALSPSPLDLARYRDVVLERFTNPAIEDSNQRVAMDGFSKIPGFIAPTIGERLARGAGIAGVAMLPALFLAYLQRWHAGQIPYPYQDQTMDAHAAHALCAAPDPVAAFAADRVLWGKLAGDARLTDALRSAYQRVVTWTRERSA